MYYFEMKERDRAANRDKSTAKGILKVKQCERGSSVMGFHSEQFSRAVGEIDEALRFRTALGGRILRRRYTTGPDVDISPVSRYASKLEWLSTGHSGRQPSGGSIENTEMVGEGRSLH
jgi:hypothetical protein